MTPQEIFDTVAKHLFQQGKRATYGEICRYRMTDPETGKGLKCAVGCLIPDELYLPNMEFQRVAKLTQRFPELPNFFTENLDFLSALQDAHDRGYHWYDDGTMKNYLKYIANGRNLNTDVLEGLSLPGK